jgi:glycolate oxidase
MALQKDIYREFEDILGPENISEEPAVLDGYTFYWIPIKYKEKDMAFPSVEESFPRPEAIVLPGSTKDVQAVLKVCNRRGIKSKATSTTYGAFSMVSSKGIIMIDLRRMNRIIDIDEKNMFIVVEPYVSFAQVQAEAMKRGLICHVITAGPSASFLASLTAVHGHNIQGISQGYSGRNLLGFEWVSPAGEILRFGSLGSGAGWFASDGPGPGLRGVVRGVAGTFGGLGVFTKAAGHLHPWSGPSTLEVEGISPEYESKIPPLFEYHIMEWPSWEKCADAQYKIGEAGIAYALHKAGGPGSHGAIISTSNNDWYERWQTGKMHIPEFTQAIVMAANFPEEHDYQVKVLARILEETDGKILPVGEETTFRNRDYIQMIRTCFTGRLAFRATGRHSSGHIMVSGDTIDNAAVALNIADRLKDKYAAKGAIYDDGMYNNWATAIEGGHWGHYEGPPATDPTNEETSIIKAQYDAEAAQATLVAPLSCAWVAVGQENAKIFSPLCGHYDTWMRKIKKAFDPNCVSDPANYISAEKE